jgi:hypothetical protein
MSTYEVLVPDAQTEEARRVLRVPERAPSSAGRLRIWLVRLLAFSLVAPLLYGAWRQLRVLF